MYLRTRLCLLLAGLGVGSFLHGQAGLVTLSAPVSSALQGSVPSAAFHQPFFDFAHGLSQSGPLTRIGPVAVRPHASVELTQAHGLLRLPGVPDDVDRQTISAGLLLDAGPGKSADYQISRVSYSSGGPNDTINQNIRAEDEVVAGPWRVKLAGQYGDNSNLLVATGCYVREQAFGANSLVAYQVGRNTELELNLRVSDRSSVAEAASFAWAESDWTLWSASTWLRRHFGPQLNVALGFAVGYDDLARGTDLWHTQPQIQVSWRPTSKISLTAEYGLEERHVWAPGGRTHRNHRYGASLQYSPVPTTSLSAEIHQSVDPSYFSGQTTEGEGWSVSLQQRLLGRFYLTATYAHLRTDYESILGIAQVNRDELYRSLSFRLTTPVMQRGSLGISYQRATNRSSVAAYDFNGHQFGEEFSYRF
jgi:hypothetical protein